MSRTLGPGPEVNGLDDAIRVLRTFYKTLSGWLTEGETRALDLVLDEIARRRPPAALVREDGAAMLPAAAPAYRGEEGCPACGAMLHFSTVSTHAPYTVAKAVCSRSSGAAQVHHPANAETGKWCLWEGWISTTPRGIRIVGHGKTAPLNWPPACLILGGRP